MIDAFSTKVSIVRFDPADSAIRGDKGQIKSTNLYASLCFVVFQLANTIYFVQILCIALESSDNAWGTFLCAF